MDKPMLFFGTLVIALIALNIWAIVDISKFPHKQSRNKWFWTNIVLLLPFFGFLIYIFIGKNFLTRASTQEKTQIL